MCENETILVEFKSSREFPMSPFIPRDGKEKKKYKDSKNPRTQFEGRRKKYFQNLYENRCRIEFSISLVVSKRIQRNKRFGKFVRRERERENERFSKFLNKVEFSSESYGTRSTPINFRHFERSQRTLQRAARPRGLAEG